jgi:hypothetical protein
LKRFNKTTSFTCLKPISPFEDDKSSISHSSDYETAVFLLRGRGDIMLRTLKDGATKLHGVTSNKRDYFHLEILHYIKVSVKKNGFSFNATLHPLTCIAY